MAFAATFSQTQSLFCHLSTTFSATTTTTTTRRRNPPFRVLCEAVKASNSSSDNKLEETKTQEPASAAASSTNSQPSTATSPPPTQGPKPKKTVYSMKKGQIVRVDKEKYLNSINYLSVGHPPYYKGLEYIYEDRGEVLDIRVFETGEYALIGWVGIPTAPAWLPTYMLIKSDKLDYERL